MRLPLHCPDTRNQVYMVIIQIILVNIKSFFFGHFYSQEMNYLGSTLMPKHAPTATQILQSGTSSLSSTD